MVVECRLGTLRPQAYHQCVYEGRKDGSKAGKEGGRKTGRGGGIEVSLWGSLKHRGYFNFIVH